MSVMSEARGGRHNLITSQGFVSGDDTHNITQRSLKHARQNVTRIECTHDAYNQYQRHATITATAATNTATATTTSTATAATTTNTPLPLLLLPLPPPLPLLLPGKALTVRTSAVTEVSDFEQLNFDLGTCAYRLTVARSTQCTHNSGNTTNQIPY